MPRHLNSDAHEWTNEVPSVPIYFPAKPQPRERTRYNQGKKTEKKALRSDFQFLGGATLDATFRNWRQGQNSKSKRPRDLKMVLFDSSLSK